MTKRVEYLRMRIPRMATSDVVILRNAQFEEYKGQIEDQRAHDARTQTGPDGEKWEPLPDGYSYQATQDTIIDYTQASDF